MITVQQIIAAVAKEYGVTVEEILEKRRMQTGARSRAAAMWCARKLTKRSFPELARDFNRDDHTTIMSGCRRYEAKATLPERTRLLLVCAWWPEVYRPIVKAQPQLESTLEAAAQ